MNLIEAAPPPGSLDSGENDFSGEITQWLRWPGISLATSWNAQQNPRGDILSELAHAEFPTAPRRGSRSGSLSTFIFGAGRIRAPSCSAMRCATSSISRPAGQAAAGPVADSGDARGGAAAEGSTKQTARLARRDTRIGNLKVPAGTKILVALAAANRDAHRSPDPQAFVLDRPKSKEHVGFGRGKQSARRTASAHGGAHLP